ncbi:MAG: peptidylprolyl isomerase [Armatimonadetes bacterium]|nr:peptidylprolyl isomerase [Armatimonadota bacterium]
MGQIVIMFYPDRAPRHVDNFLTLAKSGFFNGTRFHRCMPGFMIQGGDPLSKDLSKADAWGTGGNMVDGKEKNVQAEFNDIHHGRGVVSMARSNDPNSASSQFFIMVAENGGLDGQYSAFGYVVKGMDVADKIVATGPTDQQLNGKVDPKKAVVLKSVKVTKWPIK